MDRRSVLAAAFVTALFVLGGGGVTQDVDVYSPGRPPGQALSNDASWNEGSRGAGQLDENSAGWTGSEDQAQTHENE